MTKLDELIERLEKLGGPDHALDAEILVYSYGWIMHEDADPSEGVFAFWDNGICHNCSSWDEITKSIDAAVAFMRRALKGVVLRRVTDDDMMAIRVELTWLPDGLASGPQIKVEAWHQYEAIALCTAVLRALKAREAGE